MVFFEGKIVLYKRKSTEKKKDFINLFENGKKFYLNDYLIFYKENNNKGARLGLSISKKTGNAVNRNLEKRHLREIFRKNKVLIDNIDIIIIKKSDVKYTYSEKEKIFIKSFKKIKSLVYRTRKQYKNN